MAQAVIICAALAMSSATAWSPSTSGNPQPHLMLGPTSNNPDTIANDTVALVATKAGLAQWPDVRNSLISTGGALHIRQQVFGLMRRDGDGLQRTLGSQTKQLGLKVSIEAGGTLCGSGSGVTNANSVLTNLATFLSSGGELAYFALESVFSRTHRGCPSQKLQDTIDELATYAGVIAKAMPNTQLFLYDALPHYSVGTEWPANQDGYGLELGNVLSLLKPAMAAKGAILRGYWADCPYEYSAGILSPLPKGKDGFEKIAAAVKLVKGMGLQVGKTFNSQQGGSTSNAAFYNGTLADFSRTMAVVPSGMSGGYSFDFVMVETWYSYPKQITPETVSFTTTNTARAVFRQGAH